MAYTLQDTKPWEIFQMLQLSILEEEDVLIWIFLKYVGLSIDDIGNGIVQ